MDKEVHTPPPTPPPPNPTHAPSNSCPDARVYRTTGAQLGLTPVESDEEKTLRECRELQSLYESQMRELLVWVAATTEKLNNNAIDANDGNKIIELRVALTQYEREKAVRYVQRAKRRALQSASAHPLSAWFPVSRSQGRQEGDALVRLGADHGDARVQAARCVHATCGRGAGGRGRCMGRPARRRGRTPARPRGPARFHRPPVPTPPPSVRPLTPFVTSVIPPHSSPRALPCTTRAPAGPTRGSTRSWPSTPRAVRQRRIPALRRAPPNADPARAGLACGTEFSQSSADLRAAIAAHEVHVSTTKPAKADEFSQVAQALATLQQEQTALGMTPSQPEEVRSP